MTKIVYALAISSVAVVAALNNSTLTVATPTSVASACSFEDFTATNLDDVASVNACPTPVGNVYISGTDMVNIDLSNVKQYYGDLKVNGTNVLSFVAPNLQLVSGSFELTNNHLLQGLNLAQLATVNSLTFTSLPRLTHIDLNTGITTAQSIIISDTGLRTLDGINVFSLKVFNVNNNGAITTIDSGLEEVTDTLIITDNGREAAVKMVKLTSVKDITLGKISSFEFGQNLTRINGSVAIAESYMSTIDLSNIKSINNSLTIYANSNLLILNLSSLNSIGGALQISENKMLQSFAGSFKNLRDVGGSITINGTFNNGSFESLDNVAGGFSLLSTAGNLTCDDFNQLNMDGYVKGDLFVCSGFGTASSSSSGTAKATGTSSATSAKTSSKKSDGSLATSRGILALMFSGISAIILAL